MHAEGASSLAGEHGSWLHFLYQLGVPKWVEEPVLNCWFLILVLGVGLYLATRRLDVLPKSLQNFLEWVVEELQNFTVQIMGPQGKVFVPFIGTLFLYIALMNILGLVPGFLAPTSTLNTTVALALCVFAATQYHGIRTRGLWGYVKHLWGEPFWLGPVMFPIHMLEEFIARPLSLAVRLFGNIFGDDTVIARLGGVAVLNVLLGSYFVALGAFTFLVQAFVIWLAVIFALAQALVFATLASVYIAGAIIEEE